MVCLMSRTTPDPATLIGERVAAARVLAGLTQLELAHKIGLTGSDAGAAISRLESGTQEPRMKKLIRIAKVLKVSLDSLLPT